MAKVFHHEAQNFVAMQQNFRESFEQQMTEMLEPYFIDVPKKLHQAIFYALTTPGKRIRSYLLSVTAKNLNQNNVSCAHQAETAAAVAIELIHTYSLVHDDLPAMDNDDWRRGVPTVHRKFNEATAILVGEALHSLAYQLLADHYSGTTCQKLVRQLAKACGAQGLVGGQFDDLFEDANTIEQLQRRHYKKTGMLFDAAVSMACTLYPHTLPDNNFFNDFAFHFGLAYQMINDWQDVFGQAQDLGKPCGQDERNNKTNYALLLGSDQSLKHIKQQLHLAMQISKQIPPPNDAFVGLIQWLAQLVIQPV